MRKLWWLIVSAFVILLDYGSKHYMLAHFEPYQPWIVTSFFDLTLAFNKGAAFSFLNAASGWQNIFFIVVAALVSVVLLVWLVRLKSVEKMNALAISLILGGAWGNIYDRFVYGFVIDFIDIHIGQYHWPIFNIADSAICIGAAIMLLLSWCSEDTKTCAQSN